MPKPCTVDGCTSDAVRKAENFVLDFRPRTRRDRGRSLAELLATAPAMRALTWRQHVAKKKEWVDPYSAYSECDLSPAEYDTALAAARKDLLGGKKPVAAGKTPHLIITIGAPGPGSPRSPRRWQLSGDPATMSRSTWTPR